MPKYNYSSHRAIFNALMKKIEDIVLVFSIAENNYADTIVDASESACALLKYSREELKTMKYWDLDSSPDELKALLPKYLERVLQGYSVTTNRDLMTKDGKRISFKVDSFMINENDQVLILNVMKNLDKDINLCALNNIFDYDILTNLPNRFSFNKQLYLEVLKSKCEGSMLGIIFIDLNNFRSLNSVEGYNFGDQLLKEAAVRIRKSVNGDYFVARMGNDEFAVMVTDMKHLDDIYSKADGVLKILEESFFIFHKKIQLSYGMGISVYPFDAEEPDELVKAAEISACCTKYIFGQEELKGDNSRHNMIESLKLLSELKKAISRDEFIVVYQSKVDLSTGKIIGMEALARWIHPESGIIAPGQFIELAEQTGFVASIDDLIMKKACVQNKIWQTKGIDPVRVSVNLSAEDFCNSDIKDRVLNALKQSGLDSQYLEIEITESAAVQDLNFTGNLLKELKSLGIHISMDDFGKGFSSLNYIKNIDVDTIKIDKCFVDDITENIHIVNTIISLAHSLGMKVTAEGVECKEQMDILKELGCDYAQGYYFNKPLGNAEFEEFMQRNRISSI